MVYSYLMTIDRVKNICNDREIGIYRDSYIASHDNSYPCVRTSVHKQISKDDTYMQYSVDMNYCYRIVFYSYYTLSESCTGPIIISRT